MTDFQTAFSAQRPALLRHCYRMLGSFTDAEDLVQDVLLKAWHARASYSGEAPLSHWLMRIATNACLNELGRRRRRGLPQFDVPSSPGGSPVTMDDAADWIAPAPDARLFEQPMAALETRESVALAFLALLQRLPPRQRAALLLRDVVGWSAEETAQALELSLGSVNGALHRARQTLAVRAASSDASASLIEGPLSEEAALWNEASPSEESTLLGGASLSSEPAPQMVASPSHEPAPEALRAYLRSWEAHDVDGMVKLMREDIVFTMPPYAMWFRARTALEGFLRSAAFSKHWAAGFRLVPTRANGQIALAFYRNDGTAFVRSSLQVLRFLDERLAEVTSFVGPGYLRGFDLPEKLSFDACEVGQELGLDGSLVTLLGTFLESPNARSLVQCYREPHRHYHNLEHIQEMLGHIVRHADRFRGLRAPVFAALYHDAIYNPKRKDNEPRSAALAQEQLRERLGPEELAQVVALIDATAHHASTLQEADPDVALFLDCDAAILGAAPERYRRYAEGVRREYQHVPTLLYRVARGKFIKAMLRRPILFHTRLFELQYGKRARDNLQAELTGQW